jgi:hypothetical protein
MIGAAAPATAGAAVFICAYVIDKSMNKVRLYMPVL